MRTRSRITATLLGAGLAVLGAGTIATVVASIPSTDRTISACVAKTAHTTGIGPILAQVVDRKGTLRAIDTETGEQCASDENPVTLQIPGNQLWVIMKGDGTVASHSGEVLSDGGTGRTSKGFYQVHFSRNVSQCAALANASTHTGPFPIAIVPYIPSISHPSQSQFGVAMFGLDGFTADTEFTLVVTC